MKHIFVSDLDGTLLKSGEQKLSQETLETISKVVQSGNVFVIASARGYNELKEFFAPVLHDIYFICENGALIQYKGKTLHRQELSKEHVSEMVEQIEKYGMEWLVAGVHTIYTKGSFREIEEYRKRRKLNQMKITTLCDIKEEILRISIFFTSEVNSVVGLELRSMLREDAYISYQDGLWTDIIHSKANKGKALTWLLREIKLSRENVVAFGDNLNDIEMLHVATIPYVMSNAREELKKLFPNQTESVLKVINEKLL